MQDLNVDTVCIFSQKRTCNFCLKDKNIIQTFKLISIKITSIKKIMVRCKDIGDVKTSDKELEYAYDLPEDISKVLVLEKMTIEYV